MPSLLFNLRAVAALAFALILSACANQPDDTTRAAPPAFDEGYGPIEDGDYVLPHIEAKYTAGVNKRAIVPYLGDDRPGSIVVDPHAKFLFYILETGEAVRYPIAVGREGRGFRGSAVVRRKEVWPGWIPTANMIRTEPELYKQYASGIEGGLSSPLGARALYLYRGGVDTYFRIHGTNDLPSIGHNSSAGCIRLFNHDVIDLYERVKLGATVRVRTLEESVRIEGEAMAHRGDDEVPPVTSITVQQLPDVEPTRPVLLGSAPAG